MTKNKKNYEINFIKAQIISFYKKNSDLTIKNFHLDELEKINIENIESYNWWFRARFFYWIFDFKNKKGWIKLHWTTTQEFLIMASFVENWFFDVKIWNFQGVFANKENAKKWHNIRNKKEVFKNYNNRDVWDILFLINRLIWVNFWNELLLKVFDFKRRLVIWVVPITQFFYTQLKILKEMKKRDWSIEKHKIDKYHYFDYETFEEVMERQKIKYKYMLKYIWRENKILLYLNYNNWLETDNFYRVAYKWEDIFKINKYKKDNPYNKWNEIIKKLNQISNIHNVNFSERVKFMNKVHKELFNKF